MLLTHAQVIESSTRSLTGSIAGNMAAAFGKRAAGALTSAWVQRCSSVSHQSPCAASELLSRCGNGVQTTHMRNLQAMSRRSQTCDVFQVWCAKSRWLGDGLSPTRFCCACLRHQYSYQAALERRNYWSRRSWQDHTHSCDHQGCFQYPFQLYSSTWKLATVLCGSPISLSGLLTTCCQHAAFCTEKALSAQVLSETGGATATAFEQIDKVLLLTANGSCSTTIVCAITSIASRSCG